MNNRIPAAGELRDLLTKALALEYLRTRAVGADKSDNSDKKETWLRLFESAGFTALVTVLVGGIAGGIITAMVQHKIKDREEASVALRSQKERELTAFNRHLDTERQLVDELFQKLNAFVNASSNLAGLSERGFSADRPDPAHNKARMEIVNNYNSAGQIWDRDYSRLGMLLQLEHPDAQLDTDLHEVDAAVEAYASCADRWRREHDNLEPHQVREACAAKRFDLNQKAETFIRRIVVLRSSAIGFQATEVRGETPSSPASASR